MNKLICLYIFFITALVMISCSQEEIVSNHFSPQFMEIPKGFDEIEFPEDNLFTQEKWDLGKKLFFDPIMSIDSTISCATCHNPELAFSDDVSFSSGVENRLGTRNAPTLANVALKM